VFFFGLISLAVFFAIFVSASQRLLGVRFGLIRMVIGAALTFLVFSPLMNALAGPPPWTGSTGAAIAYLALTSICSMLAGLIFLVLSEALVPTGSLPRARDLRRDLGGRIARTRRYLQILRIAIRHGLGPYLHGRRRPGLENAAGQAELARSLRLALDEAGVTFVKLGQVLSTRSDVIPASVAQELSRLQDQVTPAPWPEIEAALTVELGAPPGQIFADFSSEPLAAASVAQVYTARLRDGSQPDVVVKRLDGIPLGNAATAIADQGLDAGRLARILFDCLLGQVAIDGEVPELYPQYSTSRVLTRAPSRGSRPISTWSDPPGSSPPRT